MQEAAIEAKSYKLLKSSFDTVSSCLRFRLFVFFGGSRTSKSPRSGEPRRSNLPSWWLSLVICLSPSNTWDFGVDHGVPGDELGHDAQHLPTSRGQLPQHRAPHLLLYVAEELGGQLPRLPPGQAAAQSQPIMVRVMDSERKGSCCWCTL